jgi:DNA-binding response OmpR family regulator
MTKKVLIIDDDEELCDEMSEVLSGEGYDVSVAFDGLEGKELVEKNPYDILLLDMKLPGLSGREILESVKKTNTKIKILILSGSPTIHKALKEDSTLSKADGLMNKPFEVTTLLNKIEDLIGKPEG